MNRYATSEMAALMAGGSWRLRPLCGLRPAIDRPKEEPR